MIRSKIEARERALELAVKTFETSQSFSSKNFMEWVTMFEKYLIGDVDLPEVVDDNDHIKTLIGMIGTEMAAFRKQGNENLDTLTNFLDKREMALSETPCKSEVE